MKHLIVDLQKEAGTLGVTLTLGHDFATDRSTVTVDGAAYASIGQAAAHLRGVRAVLEATERAKRAASGGAE